jgi:hypothetical protein
MSSQSSFFHIVKPVEGAGLTNLAIVPTNNIADTSTTYNILFNTASTGKIKTIDIEFHTSFDVSSAILTDKSVIGSGSLSNPGASVLVYTVNNPSTITQGTSIKLEIGKIINSNTPGDYKVLITTRDNVGNIIDGPTLSDSFNIKTVSGDTSMIRKTLKDDAAGNSHGWNPGDPGADGAFEISDSDMIGGSTDSTFVSVMLLGQVAETHRVTYIDTVNGVFGVNFDSPVPNGFELHYIITKLPPHVVTESLSSSTSAFDSQDIESFSRQDETSSEFP